MNVSVREIKKEREREGGNFRDVYICIWMTFSLRDIAKERKREGGEERLRDHVSK